MQLLVEKTFMPKAIAKADRIFCISATTNRKVNQHFPKVSEKCHVIKLGADRVPATSSLERLHDYDYFLAVGTLEPRKNYVNLLLAFNEYVSSGGKKKLVIVGKRGWRDDPIHLTHKNLEFKDRIKILTEVDDKELASLFDESFGFVSVSQDEGFGLPTQEALQYGLPILLSKIEVYLELFPGAEYWADPNNMHSIANSLSDFDKHSLPRKKRNTMSSWDECAESHVKEILALARGRR